MGSKIQVYTPAKKIRVNSQEAVPVLVDIGARFATLGGLIGFFFASFLASFKSFKKSKKRFREFQSKHQKTLDLS